MCKYKIKVEQINIDYGDQYNIGIVKIQMPIQINQTISLKL